MPRQRIHIVHLLCPDGDVVSFKLLARTLHRPIGRNSLSVPRGLEEVQVQPVEVASVIDISVMPEVGGRITVT